MREIDKRSTKFLKGKFKVLRSKLSGAALDVSYSEDGLKWATDRNGKSLYYEPKGFDEEGDRIYEMSKLVYVEDFIPMNHDSIACQAMEFLAVKKAYKLYYPIGTDSREFGVIK